MSKKRTHTEFLNELKEVQPSLLVVGEYVDSHTKIKVKDADGHEYMAKPCYLLNGRPISIMLAVNKTKVFKHTLSKIQPNLVVIGDYNNSKIKIEIEDAEGYKYMSRPSDLLSGYAPTIKTALNKSEVFISIAKKILPPTISYEKVNYLLNGANVTLTCSIHGDFNSTPNNILSGSSCGKCTKIGRGWSYTRWKEGAEVSKVFDSFKLYIIKCWDNNEVFYKIGKTFKTIENRFKHKREMPYSYDIIKVIIGDSRDISNLETFLHNENKLNKYFPLISFKGEGECFSNIKI